MFRPCSQHDTYLGHDEVIVVFSDDRASSIGLGRCEFVSGVFERR